MSHYEHTRRRVVRKAATAVLVAAPLMSGGAYLAIKASPETTNTAAEAAIRAVWLASAPKITPRVL